IAVLARTALVTAGVATVVVAAVARATIVTATAILAIVAICAVLASVAGAAVALSSAAARDSVVVAVAAVSGGAGRRAAGGRCDRAFERETRILESLCRFRAILRRLRYRRSHRGRRQRQDRGSGDRAQQPKTCGDATTDRHVCSPSAGSPRTGQYLFK